MSKIVLKPQRTSIPRSPKVSNFRDVVKVEEEEMEEDHPKYNPYSVADASTNYSQGYDVVTGVWHSFNKVVDLTWPIIPEYPDQFQMDEDLINE